MTIVSDRPTSQPLDGLLVIAIEQAVAAPMCTVRLADAGARVIKVERPGGETARHYDTTVHGHSAYFTWLNRSKESVELDLKTDTDLELLRSLLAQADVLVQNLLPGSLTRMGLSADVLAEQFPRLIVASIVGYGQDTAYASMRAYDLLVQAESGVCSVTGSPDEPAKVGVSAADIATGMNAHALILEALIERTRTGRGRHIEISMFDSMVEWMTVPMLHLEHAARSTQRHGMRHASIYPYRSFDTTDGNVVIAVQRNDEWGRLCTAMDRPELFERAEFAENDDRVRNRALLDAELEPWFVARSSSDVIGRLERAGVAWSRVRDTQALADHPAMRRVSVETPGGRTVLVPRPPGREILQAGPIPALGQHTAAVRLEFHRPTPTPHNEVADRSRPSDGHVSSLTSGGIR
ncbi:MAG: CaiB/BaiF CoA-transferase family protein [Nocardioidaceae bacterium]